MHESDTVPTYSPRSLTPLDRAEGSDAHSARSTLRLAVASGKGGTGKTTITTNLAYCLHTLGYPMAVADLDVEEPNAHLFLHPQWQNEHTSTLPVPQVDETICRTGCSACADACRFKALVRLPDDVMIFTEMCHGCGLCTEVCPTNAITETSRELGIVRTGPATQQFGGMPMYGGLLRIGEAMATPLINDVLAASAHETFIIRDCPPGTACPTIASMEDADFVILVAEPTAFGLHDLTLAVDLVRELGHPFGVVINRCGMGDNRVHTYLEQEGIPLLAEIPHTMEAARACFEGDLLVTALPDMRDIFTRLWERIGLEMQNTEEAKP